MIISKILKPNQQYYSILHGNVTFKRQTGPEVLIWEDCNGHAFWTNLRGHYRMNSDWSKEPIIFPNESMRDWSNYFLEEMSSYDRGNLMLRPSGRRSDLWEICKWHEGHRYVTVVAYYRKDKEGCWEIEHVGNRVFELTQEEKEDYWALAELAYETIGKNINEFEL